MPGCGIIFRLLLYYTIFRSELKANGTSDKIDKSSEEGTAVYTPIGVGDRFEVVLRPQGTW